VKNRKNRVPCEEVDDTASTPEVSH